MAYMTFGVNLLPKNDGNTYSLGNSSQKWKIYVDSINDVSDLHFTDTTYSAGTGLSLSGATFSNSGVTGIKGNAENSYRTGQVNLTASNIGAITKNEVGNTQQLFRPTAMNGVNDVTIQSLINDARANRLAFLPADQIIIEKTTDGGVTWVDAGISDAVKAGLFSEKRSPIYIPQIDGQINILCGLRITITGMKYNVPDNTPETEKYNYWNSNYVNSTERYCQLKNIYFWVSTATNTLSVKVERATGASSTNWVSCFSKDNYGMNGWSGNDFISFDQNYFGGNKSQTDRYWNYRITLMSRGPQGSETLNNTSITDVQSVLEIRGYGDGWWIKSNEYMASDHMYTWDYNKNVTFPAKINGYTLAAASEKGVDTTITAGSTSTNLPTSAAVAAFVEGKGYTTNIGTITGITMNGASKGTSGIIDLGTVITQHQDISGKADLASTVTNISYDSTNRKIKKTIGSTTSDVLEFSAGSNITLTPSSGKLTIAATDTTYSNETAASNGTDLSLVTTGEKYNWNNKGEKMVILSYGSSTWQDFLNAYNNNIVVYCRASSNSNPASGSQTRMAFMAYVNNATSPTKVEFQYYRSVATHSATQQGDQVYVYALDSSQGWSVITREAYSKIATGTGLKSSYSNSTITLSTTSLHLTKTGISSLPYTISNTNIKSDMVVVGYSVTPNTGDLTITTANGSVTISGELITGKTIDITLDLME